MTPSWYDILDVAPDASDEEIREAWKAAIAGLDPTDRKFRVYNQAAEVLLDPQRRAAFDAELAAQPDESDEDEETTAAAPAVSLDKGTAKGKVGAAKGKAGAAKGKTGAAVLTRLRRASRPSTASGSSVPMIPAWALAVVAVLAAASVAAAAWLGFTQPSDASVEESTRAAQSAAERAIQPILSYDYRHLDEDKAAAESYMTSGYREDYDKLFEVVKDNAPRTKTVVKADVLASGIVRSGADRVEVLLFVDQSTTNAQKTTPVIYKNQVRAQMEKVGGDWLVDCMITTPNGHCD